MYEVMRKYYIFGYSDYIKNSLDDIISESNVKYFDLFKPTSKVKWIIHRLFVSRYTHCFSRILMPIWGKTYWEGNEPEKDSDAVLLLYEINPISNKQDWIMHVKKTHPSIKVVYIFTNIIDANNEWRLHRILNRRELYDIVMTFNKSDAEKYNLTHYEGVFSPKKIDQSLVDSAKPYDVYFCGLDKGRLKLLNEIYMCLTSKGITCRFDVIYPQIDVNPDAKGIVTHTSLVDNDTMLANVLKCKCILEVMVDRTQPGSSLRMCESIAYGKKLLTNNPFAKEKSFYNKKQMFYFDSPDDIDIDFIRSSIEEADYAEKDSLSPRNLLAFIDSQV